MHKEAGWGVKKRVSGVRLISKGGFVHYQLKNLHIKLNQRSNIVKKKSFIAVLAFMLIATFVFAGGEKEKVTPTTAPGGPQYGGTFTYTY